MNIEVIWDEVIEVFHISVNGTRLLECLFADDLKELTVADIKKLYEEAWQEDKNG